MWYWHDGTGWWMVFVMVLFWGAILGLVVWGIRSLIAADRSKLGASEKGHPLDILKERYSRGEISRQEFDQIRKDLSGLQ